MRTVAEAAALFNSLMGEGKGELPLVILDPLGDETFYVSDIKQRDANPDYGTSCPEGHDHVVFVRAD